MIHASTESKEPLTPTTGCKLSSISPRRKFYVAASEGLAAAVRLNSENTQTSMKRILHLSVANATLDVAQECYRLAASYLRCREYRIANTFLIEMEALLKNQVLEFHNQHASNINSSASSTECEDVRKRGGDTIAVERRKEELAAAFEQTLRAFEEMREESLFSTCTGGIRSVAPPAPPSSAAAVHAKASRPASARPLPASRYHQKCCSIGLDGSPTSTMAASSQHQRGGTAADASRRLDAGAVMKVHLPQSVLKSTSAPRLRGGTAGPLLTERPELTEALNDLDSELHDDFSPFALSQPSSLQRRTVPQASPERQADRGPSTFSAKKAMSLTSGKRSIPSEFQQAGSSRSQKRNDVALSCEPKKQRIQDRDVQIVDTNEVKQQQLRLRPTLPTKSARRPIYVSRRMRQEQKRIEKLQQARERQAAATICKFIWRCVWWERARQAMWDGHYARKSSRIRLSRVLRGAIARNVLRLTHQRIISACRVQRWFRCCRSLAVASQRRRAVHGHITARVVSEASETRRWLKGFNRARATMQVRRRLEHVARCIEERIALEGSDGALDIAESEEQHHALLLSRIDYLSNSQWVGSGGGGSRYNLAHSSCSSSSYRISHHQTEELEETSLRAPTQASEELSVRELEDEADRIASTRHAAQVVISKYFRRFRERATIVSLRARGSLKQLVSLSMTSGMASQAMLDDGLTIYDALHLRPGNASVRISCPSQ